MNWIVARIKWILLAAGAVTCSMLYAAVWPADAVDLLFDRTLESAFSQLIVASWAALVGIVGAMLIHAAFVPGARMLALTVAGSSKLAFLALMLARGRQYLDERVGIVLALDALMVALFALFMIQLRRAGTRGGAARGASATPEAGADRGGSPVGVADEAVGAPTRRASTSGVTLGVPRDARAVSPAGGVPGRTGRQASRGRAA